MPVAPPVNSTTQASHLALHVAAQLKPPPFIMFSLDFHDRWKVEVARAVSVLPPFSTHEACAEKAFGANSYQLDSFSQDWQDTQLQHTL